MSAKNIEKLSLPGEEWRPLEAFPGYEISSFGRVYSFYSHRLLPLHKSHFRVFGGKKAYQTREYYSVALQREKGRTTRRYVHQLVARTFVPNDDPAVKTVVDHIDNDPLNNMACNLRWTTGAENFRQAKTYEIQKYTRWLIRHNKTKGEQK